MDKVRFGYWEKCGDGRKVCHDEKPDWWERKFRAGSRIGLGYCGYNAAHPKGGDYAWSHVFDTYEAAYAFWEAAKAEADELGLTAPPAPQELPESIESVIRRAARERFGAILGIVTATEEEFRLAIAESDPEHENYPALTISAIVTAAGVTFSKADYYLTIRTALEQLDEWVAAERERLALLKRPTKVRQETE